MTDKHAYVGPDDELLIRNSVVLVMDQLGSSAWMRTSFDTEALASRSNLLKNASDALGHHPPINSVLSYTDNILLAEPIRKADAPLEVGLVIVSAAWYQLTLALEGVLCRGAIAVGPHHGSPGIVAGPALLEAHDLEQNSAHHPRVLLSSRALDAVLQDGSWYGDGNMLAYTPYNENLLRSADGEVFVGYLSALEDLDERWTADEAVNTHRQHIEASLSRDDLPERARIKWVWTAGYHNWFVKRGRFQDTLLVADIPPLELSPFAGEPNPRDPSLPSPPYPPLEADESPRA